MNTVIKDEKRQEGRHDTIKWFVVAIIIAAGVWGNSHFQEVSLLYRVMVLVFMGIVVAFVAKQTRKGSLFWEMLKEAKAEVRRVVWPTRQEVIQTTLIVLVVVLLMGLVLWGVDSLLGWVVKNFIQ